MSNPVDICSFCGRGTGQVPLNFVVAGAKAAICMDCVDIARLTLAGGLAYQQRRGNVYHVDFDPNVMDEDWRPDGTT